MKKVDNWKIEDIGVCEDVVYDIETASHDFFANGILVHNSNYMDLTDVLTEFYKIKPNADRNEATDFIDKVCRKIEKDCLKPAFDKVKYECNGYEGGGYHMDREAIAIPYRKTGYSGLWTAKKRYFLMISDMEDYRYEEPHRKIMGMYSVTSTCPEFVKPVFNNTIELLIKDGPDEARRCVNDFKKVFYSKTVEEISFPKSVSDVTKYTNPATGLPWNDEDWYDASSGKNRHGGVPINAKAAINHNYLIKQLGLEKKYQPIRDGDKMKYAYLNYNRYGFTVIGFHENLPEEFGLRNSVSYDTHWEKIVYSPINDIFVACDMTLDKITTIDDFF